MATYKTLTMKKLSLLTLVVMADLPCMLKMQRLV
jgi:hypothetical protein